MNLDLAKDRTWLDGYRAGEAWALERAFRTYARLVLVMVRQGTAGVGGRPGQDEEDLLQEVFARAMAPAARQAYSGLVPFSGYLRGFVRLVLLEAHRPAKAQLQDVLAEQAHPLDGWSPGDPLPDQVLMSQEERALVARFKEGLSPLDRAIIQSRFEQGLSQRDAADAVGSTRQVVRRRESHLVDALVRYLRQVGLMEKK